MSSDPARSAFEREVAKTYADASSIHTQAVSDPRLAVPGFTAFEAAVAVGSDTVSMRGWACDDGTKVVLARRLSFGPLLEALGFRDDARSPSAREIAERLAWMHGPSFTLVDQVAEGECGAEQTLYVEPERDPQDDGRVEFRFALKARDPEEVIQYRVFGNPDGSYKIDIYPLAPR